MRIPLKYNLLSLVRRRLSTGMTAAGIGLVVAVFIITMSLGEGIKTSLVATGHPLNLIVLRQGATAENSSFVSRNAYFIIRYLDGVAAVTREEAAMRTGLGTGAFHEDPVALATAEGVYVINTPKKGATVGANVMVRGVSAQTFLLRPEVRLVAGRWFKPGLREVVVSRQIADRYQNLEIGDTIRFAKGPWTVVGHFTAGSTAFNSEVWGDVLEMMADFNRPQFASVTLRATDAGEAERLIARIESDPQLSFKVQREAEYYEAQMISAMPIRVLGTFMASIMAIGACFAAMNTMYASVASRTKEIGALRVLGYQPRDILVSFLIESVLLALAGGLVGCLLAAPLNGLATGTANWVTFAEISFRFTITPQLYAQGIAFAVFMGIIGGFPPARNAARRSILSTLKDTH